MLASTSENNIGECRLSTEVSPKKLEKIRSHISHDLLKNGFLERLGTSRGTYETNPMKSDLVERAWGHIREECAETSSVIRVVNGAITKWAEVEEAISDFFRSAPESCGLSTTRLFNETKIRCLDPHVGWLIVMRTFVEDFYSLARRPAEERAGRLKEFWHAADELHDAIRSMGPRLGGEGHRFGDFFRSPSEQ